MKKISLILLIVLATVLMADSQQPYKIEKDSPLSNVEHVTYIRFTDYAQIPDIENEILNQVDTVIISREKIMLTVEDDLVKIYWKEIKTKQEAQ